VVHVISEKKTCWKVVGQRVFFGFCVESQLQKSFKQNGNLRGANERVVFNLFFSKGSVELLQRIALFAFPTQFLLFSNTVFWEGTVQK